MKRRIVKKTIDDKEMYRVEYKGWFFWHPYLTLFTERDRKKKIIFKPRFGLKFIWAYLESGFKICDYEFLGIDDGGWNRVLYYDTMQDAMDALNAIAVVEDAKPPKISESVVYKKEN